MATVSGSRQQVASGSGVFHRLLVAGYRNVSANKIEAGAKLAGAAQECLFVFRCQRRGAGEFEGDRILVAAVDLQLVVQVRTRGQTRGADVADDLSLLNRAADAQAGTKTRQVTVKRTEGTAMFQHDRLTVATVPAQGRDPAGRSRAHRGSRRRGLGGTGVCPPGLEP